MSRRPDPRQTALNGGGTYRVPERVQPRAPVTRSNDSFAAELILALEEAAAAPAAPVSPHHTWGKLQFDWPDVSAVELEAVARALLSGNPAAALDAFPLTETLVCTVEDCARPRATRPGKLTAGVELARAAGEQEAQLAVRLAFQRLAASLLTCVSHLVGLTEEQAAAKLLKLTCTAPVLDDRGHDDVEDADSPQVHGSAADAAHEASQEAHGSDSSDWEDIVPPSSAWPVPQPQAADAADGTPAAADVGTKLSWLLCRFSYRMLDLPGVWAEAKLTGVVLAILKALHDQHRDSTWAQHVSIHLCHLLLDRWCSSANAVADADLPGVMRLLAAESQSRDVHDDESPLRMLAKLAGQPRDVACAAWPQLHACMGDVIAPRAERLTTASHKQQREAVDEAASLLGDILACYALHAPGGSNVGGTLLRTGVLRSAAALLAQAHAALALRTGVLVVCARAPEACSYVAAVGGASANLADGSGDAVNCLWPLVAGGSSEALCAVLTAAQGGEATAVKEAQEKLVLLLDCMRAAQAVRPLWRPGDAVHATLLGLQSSLRAVSSDEPSGGEPNDEMSAADKAHSRRAALRRHVKEALSTADGTSQKKD